MTRNMKAANSAVFARLSTFSQDRGFPVPNPQAARWIHANPEADAILKSAKIIKRMSFGRFRHLAWVEHDARHFVGAIGFDHDLEDPSLRLLDDVQGFDVCLISELPVFPRKSGADVFNVVGAGSGDDGDSYRGHDHELVLDLFPTFRVYESAAPIQDDVVWSMFLGVCVEESRHGGSWIEDDLSGSLSVLAELNIVSLPYQELCRSVLDLDPRSLYMSLYRCVEATYAYEKASKLKDALSLTVAWTEVAALLESEMAWRPLEAQSLNAVLSHAQTVDLRDVCDCLSVSPGTDLASSAGTAIYKLRNQIVHFRPTRDPLDFDAVDWNRLCNALVGIAMAVFHRAYG